MPTAANQKGIAHLFLILIVLGGIVLGVYLSLNPQVFSPRAQTAPPPAVKLYPHDQNTDFSPYSSPRPETVDIEIKEIKW